MENKKPTTKTDIARIILGRRTIAFHKVFAEITGNINSGLFLSQAYYWSGRSSKKKDGWFFKSVKDWTAETGLTRYQQEYARKVLKDKNILLEKKEGNPYHLVFKVNFEVVKELIEQLPEESDEGEEDEFDGPDGGGTPNLVGRENRVPKVAEPRTEYVAEPRTLYTEITRDDTENTFIEQKSSAKPFSNPVMVPEKIPENGIPATEFKPAVSQKELIPIKHIPRICKDYGLVMESDKFWKDDIRKLTLNYGGTAVVDAFQSWVESQTGDIKYPVSKFTKVAVNYIKGTKETRKDNPGLQALMISLYKIGNITFDNRHKSVLNDLLDKYQFKEIEQAYKDFIVGKDDFDMKFAPKNFTEGAAETIILTNKELNERKQKMIDEMNRKAIADRQAIEAEEIVEDQKEEL